MRTPYLLLVVCGLLFACDGDGDGADDDGGGAEDGAGSGAGSKAESGSVGDYCAAQCERADECGELLASVEQCETTCAKFSGKLEADRPCLFTAACIEGHRTLSCEEVAEIGVPKACDDACN